MNTSPLPPSPEPALARAEIGSVTERFDPIACLDERVRHRALPVARPGEAAPGRYIQIEGPQQTLLIPLADTVVHVGRGIGADLHLDEASVSRRHALIVPHPDGVRVLDNRSANGTIVNGQRVQQAELAHGDVIVLGRVALRYLAL